MANWGDSKSFWKGEIDFFLSLLGFGNLRVLYYFIASVSAEGL